MHSEPIDLHPGTSCCITSLESLTSRLEFIDATHRIKDFTMLDCTHSLKQVHDLSLGDVRGKVPNIPLEGRGQKYDTHMQWIRRCIV